MNFNEYQEKCKRTMPKELADLDMLVNMQMGLSGESGEVADHIKKALFQGHKIDLDYIAKELGDLLWYISLGATALNIDLSEIAEMNIEKLKKRYPDGFDAERSVNRND